MAWLWFFAGIAFCAITLAIGLAAAVVTWIVREFDDLLR